MRLLNAKVKLKWGQGEGFWGIGFFLGRIGFWGLETLIELGDGG